MGIPMVHSQYELRSFSNNVNDRRWHMPPTSVGFVVTKLGKRNALINPEVTQLPVGGDFDCSGALAAVVHHRSGDVVFELGYVELKELEQLFRPNPDGTDSCPQAASVRTVCQQAIGSRTLKAYLVFVGPRHADWKEESLCPVKIAVLKEFKRPRRRRIQSIH